MSASPRLRPPGHPTRVPFVAVGGYLGSGKTTLVNHVLGRSAGARIVVLVNDFGAVNVDADLVRSRSEDTIELENGCVCCSLQDGMATAVRRIRAMTPAPDLVLVEVSGVGDPAAVASWGDHPGFRRGPVVVCADVEQVRRRASDRWVGDTVRRQLAGGDLLLLTKTDLVDDEATARVRAWLAGLVPAPVHTERELVLDLLVATVRTEEPAPVPPAASAGSGHDAAAEHQEWTIEGGSPVDVAELERALGDLPDSVVRAKGVLRSQAHPSRRTVLQLVGDRVSIDDDGPWHGDAPSRLVVIASRRPDGSPVAELLDRTVRPLFRG